MSRVFIRRALEQVEGDTLVTQFTLEDLLEAVQQQDDTPYVYADVDARGRVCGAAGPHVARACVRAPLAPTALARTARLALLAPHAPHAPHALELRADAQHELLLWFDDQLLAAIDMPFLTLRNIRGRQHYHCHECGERFQEPNPLKVHLFMNCSPPEPVAFWREVVERVRRSTLAPPPPVAPPGPLAAAQLEALATEWGRSCGGRLGHVCVYCGKLYSRRYGLKIHLRTHTGYRPLRCRYCLRAFGDPSNLNKHVRLHAARAASPGARSAPGAPGSPHTCGVCGRALARRRDLERHLRAHGLTPTATLARAQTLIPTPTLTPRNE